MRCVELAIRAALSLGADCYGASTFDRKHYFYPDLAHGYQITQHYRPFATGGRLVVNEAQFVRIKQIQLEQA
jgi:aspartyl-tRNA(Asn)/glutamyl-tRNA(Gln) amidotransferase subunit B